MMRRVFVLGSTLQPLMPCHPARARKLLREGRAAVYRRQPFTIVLKGRADGAVQPVSFQADPGSKTTGLALVGEFPKQGRVVLWAADLGHRGERIKLGLIARQSLRRGRRGRKTRYRQPRFLNRTRPAGWLPPSLRSRVANVTGWYGRLRKAVPIHEAHVETVRFDTQLLQDATLAGVQYQQGTLAGYEVRQYVLLRGGHACAYCGVKRVPLQLEHVVARARGGSNRVSNLVPSCEPCNTAKSTRPVEVFLARRPEVLEKIKAQLRAPLKDAAAVNATRWAIYEALRATGLPVALWSGGRTKYNRTRQGYPKDHWIDAACVGARGERVHIPCALRALAIRAAGRGRRQVVRTDRFGFPRGAAGRVKRVHGFQTGDLVRLDQPAGKHAGRHVGPLAGVRARGAFDLKTAGGKITAPWSRFTLLQRADGYTYAEASAATTGE